MIHSNGLLFILTLRCEAASELASRELDEALPRVERAALWCHLLACRSCRRFRKHLRVIHEAIRRNRGNPAEAEGGEGLSPQARDRIARAIREACGEQADAGSPPDSSG